MCKYNYEHYVPIPHRARTFSIMIKVFDNNNGYGIFVGLRRML